MSDIFEQLAEKDIPPSPEEFDREVYERLNHALVTQHFVELVFRAFPSIFAEFIAAIYGLLRYSVTGRFDKNRR